MTGQVILVHGLAQLDGLREDWHPGDRAYFEYHCWEDYGSSEAELWLRSHQQVHILCRDTDDALDAPLAERLDEGQERMFRILFPDGYVGTAFEDELLTGPEYFSRPDPPPRPASENQEKL